MKKIWHLFLLFVMIIFCVSCDNAPTSNEDFCTAPAFYIKTEDNKPIISKTDYTRGTFSIKLADDEYNVDNLPMKIRGRGNATWEIMEKKSYKIRFDNAINILGAGKGEERTWLLLANHCDKTLLRNYAAFKLAKILEGFEYVSSCELVEVYMNGKYDGVYMLCEQVQVSKNRVNITDSGHLIELDQYAKGTLDVDYFEVYGLPYSIKSKIENPEQVEYLKSYVKSVEDAVNGGIQSEIAKLIDMESFTDMYILQEYMKNVDVGWSSFYMYMKDEKSKLYFGPPWDFDLAAGNDFRLDNGSHDKIYIGEGRPDLDQSHRWFISIMKNDWFKTMVNKRWNEINDYIPAVINDVEQMGIKYRNTCERNFKRWKIFDERINQEPEHILDFDKYTEHLDHLINWLNKRLEWLNNEFSDM